MRRRAVARAAAGSAGAAGGACWFFFWFLLFSRSLPTISIAEVKEHLAHEHAHAEEGSHE